MLRKQKGRQRYAQFTPSSAHRHKPKHKVILGGKNEATKVLVVVERGAQATLRASEVAFMATASEEILFPSRKERMNVVIPNN